MSNNKDVILGDAHLKSLTTPSAVIGTRGTNGWVPFTPTITANTPPVLGSGLITNAAYNVVGKMMDILVEFSASGAGTAGSGNYSFPLPNGYRAVTNLGAPVGTAFIGSGSALVLGGVGINATDGGRSLFLFATQTPAGTLNTLTTIGASNYGANGTNVAYTFTARFEIRG